MEEGNQKLSGLRKESIKDSFRNFDNTEHRLEFVASVRGVDFVNDSRATSVNATWYALEAQKKPIVWIGGGLLNGQDFTQLNDVAKLKVKHLVILSNDPKKMKEHFSPLLDNIETVETMTEALKIARMVSNKGDVILLSPAAASFDMYQNYQERGWEFKRLVKNDN